jgi:hypothetical protein
MVIAGVPAYPEMNDGIATKPYSPTGVTLLARINLVVYILLLFWALPSVYVLVSLVAIGVVLYSIAGIACSWGLLQHKSRGWYMAVTMWMVEGMVSSWTAIANSGDFSTYPQTVILFLSIAFFRFASTAYLTKKKFRDGFGIYRHSDTSVHDNTPAGADWVPVENKTE